MIFQKNSLVEMIKKELKIRGIEDREKAISLKYSHERTGKIKNLYPNEAVKVLDALNEFTDESLLKYIYIAACDLLIIKHPEQSIVNDNSIIDYLKENKIIHSETNEIEVVNPVKKVKIIAPFTNLKFVEKELLLSLFGDVLIKKMMVMN